MADFEAFTRLYGDCLDEASFERLSWRAHRILEAAVTGVDGVCKLTVSPPEGDAAEAVSRCECALVDVLRRVEAAEEFSEAARSTTDTGAGVRGGVIASVSAGNEFVTYKSPDTAGSAFSRAAADPGAARELYDSVIREYLSGVCDARGVALLYMGAYPFAAE